MRGVIHIFAIIVTEEKKTSLDTGLTAESCVILPNLRLAFCDAARMISIVRKQEKWYNQPASYCIHYQPV